VIKSCKLSYRYITNQGSERKEDRMMVSESNIGKERISEGYPRQPRAYGDTETPAAGNRELRKAPNPTTLRQHRRHHKRRRLLFILVPKESALIHTSEAPYYTVPATLLVQLLSCFSNNTSANNPNALRSGSTTHYACGTYCEVFSVLLHKPDGVKRTTNRICAWYAPIGSISPNNALIDLTQNTSLRPSISQRNTTGSLRL
jgi:hypothetical protein